ncbi:cytochrome c oxidase subunit VB-domain-containing protein [Lipomyces kononenkoae]|uniref:Cytochrome c oxidase subunit VB-domain-containing protein n=1 Tax=Lipomyces kononenkoae TaxID=34357 RepID=A0ACC3T2W6_LIPKO
MFLRQIVSSSRVAVRRAPAAFIWANAAAVRPSSSRYFSCTVRRAATTPAKPTGGEVEEVEGPRVSTHISEVARTEDLFGPGAEPGEIPSDFEQATGLERLELLSNMAGIDIWDLDPLPSHRVGTIENPIIVDSPTEQKFIGCTGSPADSHEIEWINASIYEPARCLECGSVYQLNYVGPADEIHADASKGVYFIEAEEEEKSPELPKP